LGTVAATLTTYYGPGASGSGVAEIIGYLSGINYPEVISVPSLITKVFGVIIAIAGTLCIGKEGPLAHIGGILGAYILYLPGNHFQFLHNDHKKREFIAAGSSAGVSVAFGAPIGGALFMFELTSFNTFWKFALLWKIFLTCTTAVCSIAILEALAHAELSSWSSASIKFGEIRIFDVTPSDVIVGAIILGVVAGILGAFFIGTNTKINELRAKLWTSKWTKPIDTFIFAFSTATAFYWFPYWYRSCVSRRVLQNNLSQELDLSLDQVLDSEENQSVFKAWCYYESDFDPLASIFWQTEGGLIRDILSESVMCSL
jgi:chloride channel 7